MKNQGPNSNAEDTWVAGEGVGELKQAKQL